VTGGLIGCWLVCGVIVAVIASAKNRNALGWLALGALFAPSVLIVAVLPKLPPGPPEGMRSVQCPRCNAVQNIPHGQTTFECWQCKLVNNVAGAGYVAGKRRPDGPEGHPRMAEPYKEAARWWLKMPAGRATNSYGWRLTKALLAVALVATPALQPSLAYADPGDDFLAALDKYGIDLSALMSEPISPQDAIELGRDICNDLHSGTSPIAEANGLYRMMPKITDKQSGNVVSAAQFTLCPDTLS
jgi:Protein of unknown function (DUF732)